MALKTTDPTTSLRLGKLQQHYLDTKWQSIKELFPRIRTGQKILTTMAQQAAMTVPLKIC